MTEEFKAINAYKNIEDFWCISLGNDPKLWEAAFSHAPIDSWSIDKKFFGANKRFNYLISLMVSFSDTRSIYSNRDNESNAEWSALLSKVLAHKKITNLDALKEALFAGIGAHYFQRITLKPCGDDNLLSSMLRQHKELIEEDKGLKDALLAHAIEFKKKECRDVLLGWGASAQKSLHLVKSKEDLNVLLAAGANLYEPLKEDPRSAYAIDVIDKTKESLAENKLVIDFIKSKSKVFYSVLDKDEVNVLLNSLSIEKLSGDDKIRYVFSVIEKESREQVINTIVKKSMPDIFTWTIKYGDDEVGFLAWVAMHKKEYLIKKDVIAKIPSELFFKKTKNGKEAQEWLWTPQQLMSSKEINTIWQKNGLTADQKLRVLSNGRAAPVFWCPIGKDVGLESMTDEEFWGAWDVQQDLIKDKIISGIGFQNSYENRFVKKLIGSTIEAAVLKYQTEIADKEKKTKKSI
jgi:plasmid maintenance system killer protein